MYEILGKNLHPMEPAKWNLRHLLAYCSLHELPYENSGEKLSKERRVELEKFVAADLHAFYAKSNVVDTPVTKPNILDTPSEELFVRRTSPHCAAFFRAHPKKLKDVFEVGLSLLDDNLLRGSYVSFKMPLLEWWLMLTLDNEGCKMLEPSGSSPRVCGRTLEKNEAIAYCLECATDETCVLCAQCFKNSPCMNHKHIVRYGGGDGICDCGDPDAWNPASFCTNHRGFSEEDDPTSGSDLITKEWFQVVVRGLVLYQTKVLETCFLWVKDADKAVDERRKVSWFDRVLRRTTAMTLAIANSGDCPRRLLNIALMEKSYWFHPIMTTENDKKNNCDNEEENNFNLLFAPSSCLEGLFLANLMLASQDGLIILNKSLIYLLDACLCDPLIRIPIAELLLKYGERLSIETEHHVSKLWIQVFTVKKVVDELLQKKQHEYWESVLGPRNILHRLLSIVLYTCCNVQDHYKKLLNYSGNVYRNCQTLYEVLSTSDNCKIMLASRMLFRAWYNVLCIVGSNSKVRRDVDPTASRKPILESDYAMLMESVLRPVFYILGNMAYDIGTNLLLGNEPISAWMKTTAQLPPSLCWKASGSLVDCPSYQTVLTALSSANEPPLLFFNHTNGSGGGMHRMYMKELLKEAMILINSTLSKQRARFFSRKTDFFAVGYDSYNKGSSSSNNNNRNNKNKLRGLPYYDLLDEKHPNPTSYVKPHMRFFALLVGMWARLLKKQKKLQEQQQRNNVAEFSNRKCSRDDFTCDDSDENECFYFLVSELFVETEARGDYWLDECLMHFVLMAQLEEGLWRPHIEDVGLRYKLYLNNTNTDVEADVYLLQLLMLILPTEAYSIQVLQRHVFKDTNKKNCLLFSHFLRLIITLCVTEWNIPISSVSVLKNFMRKKIVHGILIAHEYTFSMMEDIALELKNVIPGVDTKELLPSIVEESFVFRMRPRGQVFNLKDATTWRANVSLYNPHTRDGHLLDMCSTYELLSRREQMARKRDDQVAENLEIIPLPLPNFPWMKNSNNCTKKNYKEQVAKTWCENKEEREKEKVKHKEKEYEEISDEAAIQEKVYLLLQTPAVISVAISVVHLYLFQAKEKHTEKNHIFVGDSALLHAVTVLYLSMRACKAISSVISPTTAVTNVVDWDNVKKFQEDLMLKPSPLPVRYSLEDVSNILPVRDILKAVTLKEKLEINVFLNPLFGFFLRTFKGGITTVNALQELCEIVKQQGKDICGIVRMATYILNNVGASSQSMALLSTGEKEKVLRLETEDQRRKRLKEKQMALLQRVKAQDNKELHKLIDSANTQNTSTLAPTGVGCNADENTLVSIPADIPRETTTTNCDAPSFSSFISVVSVLLLRLADVECCMCRDRNKEPLVLLANISFSDVLYRLDFYKQSTKHTDGGKETSMLNVHIHLCGHAAHEKCVAKTFGRIAKLMSEDNLLLTSGGVNTYGLNCPVCTMSCTAFCPFPTLVSQSECKNTYSFSFLSFFSNLNSALCLFERVRRDTLGHGAKFDKLHQSLAHAAAGESVLGQSASKAAGTGNNNNNNNNLLFAKKETKRLLTLAPVETLCAIVSHLRVALEWVKAGGEVQYNELLTLLSLLVSFDPSGPALDVPALKNELSARDERLPLLLLIILQNPQKVSNLLASYTKMLILSSDTKILGALPSLSLENNKNYNGLLISFWKELGCLTLLKTMFMDLSPPEVVQLKDDKVSIIPLNPNTLITLEGRQSAVLTMLCYLLDRSFDNKDDERGWEPGTALSSLVNLLATDSKENISKSSTEMLMFDFTFVHTMNFDSLPIVYENPSSWRRFIVHNVFHLADTIGEVFLNISSHKRCSVCGDAEARRVQCCFCGCSLCARPSLSPPELHDHAQRCGRGLGVYLNPSEYTLTVLLTSQCNCLYYSGLYTDEYGQTGKHELSGRSASLNNEAIKSFLSLWMRSRWEVDSVILRRLIRYDARHI